MKRSLLLCALSALLLILSFPNFNLWILAWLGFVPLFLALENKSKVKSFLLSYFTGVIFWFGIIYWLVHVTFIGMIVLALYLALYFGIFGLIFKIHGIRTTEYGILFIPSVWVTLEYLRGHLFTGFPWALLGYSQYLNLPAIQISDITGAWGVSFLVLMANVAVYSVVRRPSSVVRRQQIALPFLFIILSLIYGFYQINGIRNTEYGIRNKISVIQPNIPQELKWAPSATELIFNKHISLTREVAMDKPDLIIWPEAAIPVILEEEPGYSEKLASLAKEVNVFLLLGAVTLRGNLYYNSALLISNAGRILDRYDKLHLVPFGEYVPLKNIFKFLETIVPIGDFTSGKEYTVFSLTAPRFRLPAPRFSVLICFEDVFPELARGFINKGAEFLVNITNDAWFGRTSSPDQHLQASVFRAVENRVFLIRSANTGVSGFIAPDGRIISLVKDNLGRNIFIDGYRTEEIKIQKMPPPFYTRYGDIFVLVCLALTLYGIISLLKNKR